MHCDLPRALFRNLKSQNKITVNFAALFLSLVSPFLFTTFVHRWLSSAIFEQVKVR